MKFLNFLLLLLITGLLSGCVLTKLVTVPMRIAGAVTSIIPIAGNTVDDTIDKAADTIDKIPF